MKKLLLLTTLLSSPAFASVDKPCLSIYDKNAEIAFYNGTPEGVIISKGQSYKIKTNNKKIPKGKKLLKNLPNNLEFSPEILGIWGEYDEPGTWMQYISCSCICNKSKCYSRCMDVEE